jgi:hypothetical protein
MGTMGGSTGASRRNLMVPDDLWRRMTQAAAREMARRGEASYSVSEWIREACEERLERDEFDKG